MNKNIMIVAVVVLLIALFFGGYFLKKGDFASVEIQEQGKKVQEQGTELQNEEIFRTLSDSFTISCPAGVVCNENFDYRAYQYQSDDFGWFYLSFKPQIVGNYNLQAFKDNFNYANLRVNFPEKSSGSSEAYYQNLNPIMKINFVSYENNVLSGELNFVVDEITTRAPGDCVYDDISGWCYEGETVNFDYRLEFHMIVPE